MSESKNQGASFIHGPASHKGEILVTKYRGHGDASFAKGIWRDHFGGECHGAVIYTNIFEIDDLIHSFLLNQLEAKPSSSSNSSPQSQIILNVLECK